VTGRSDTPTIEIGGRTIGTGHPTYVIAEVSANHNQDIEQAFAIVRAAAEAGADAVKLQTYRPDTITIDVDRPEFVVGGTIWEGRKLYDLYAEAMTPWEWHAPLMAEAASLGLHCFSSPFDLTAVEFLVSLDVPAIKIASFELVDHALIAAAAATGKPLIMSTGMAQKDEIAEALAVARAHGAGGVALLRCNSTYPAPADEMDLATIGDLRASFDVPVGLSDHTLEDTTSVVAVALGACVLEKHITLRRSDGGPDSAFSLEPHEFARLVQTVRTVETSIGQVRYGPAPKERASLAFRRSLYVVADVEAGDVLTTENVRSIRPANGMAPKELPSVLGRRAKQRIERGTPLSWDLLQA
jgi:pseudaminic acid synthase